MAQIDFDPEDYIDEIPTRYLIMELKKREVLPENFDEFTTEKTSNIKTRAVLIDMFKLHLTATVEDIIEAVKENYNK